MGDEFLYVIRISTFWKCLIRSSKIDFFILTIGVLSASNNTE